jgi:adenylate cyclase
LAAQSLQLTLRGYFEQAKAAERDGVDYAAEFGHPQTTAHQLAYKLLRGEFQQDYSEQDETAAALAQHASEHQTVFWSLWTNIFRGFTAARSGRPLEGVEMIDNSLQIFAEMQFTYYRAYHLGLRARAYELAGDIESALASVSEAITVARQGGETVVLADLLRICGELRLAESGGSAAALAENLFNEAIGLAQAQASKLHEVRAATSLARLWGKHGRGADAQKLLQPIYAWFTEGLQAPDLANARAVLDELAADATERGAQAGRSMFA